MADAKVQAAARPSPADDPRAATVTPRVDVFETEDALTVLVDMPGVRPDDADVRFEGGELAVHGRRAAAHADKARVYADLDAPGYFRSFRVSEHIAADKIAADLRHGVLTLTLPKVEAVKPRRIAVRG